MKRNRKPASKRMDVSTPPGLEVREVPRKGRGVFAARRFRRGALIECCPVLPIPAKDWRHLRRTALAGYPYDWESSPGDFALVLGLGSLYNHAARPNAGNQERPDLGAMDFIALRNIRKGEEITVDYASGEGASALWFRVR